MKRLPFIIGFMLVALLQIQVQAQQNFSYQAALRNADGTVLANQTVDITISILPTATPNVSVIYSEEHSYSITNGMGIVFLKIGTGTVKSGTFATIPWGDDIYIQVDVKKAGGAYQLVGTSQILSVPYAIQAGTVKEVKSLSAAEDAIFEVKNSDGFVVFGVYQGGVRMYVAPPSTSKGAKGGFAVGGISSSKVNEEYLSIYPDSARISFNEAATTKGAKGGFAVGGISSSKSGANNDLFKVTIDSTYFSTTLSTTADIVTTGNINYGGTVAYDSTLLSAVKDADGNSYKVAYIGNQAWMTENLRTTKYSYDSSTISAQYMTVYGNSTNPVDIKTYGRLYNYIAIMTKNVCPTGWRIPTNADWTTLLVTVGGINWAGNAIATGLRLMESGTIANGDGYWTTDNNAKNESGFSGRPGGQATIPLYTWNYSNKGSMGYWWGVDKVGTNPTSFSFVQLNGTGGAVTQTIIGTSPQSTTPAISVRCVKGTSLFIQ